MSPQTLLACADAANSHEARGIKFKVDPDACAEDLKQIVPSSLPEPTAIHHRDRRPTESGRHDRLLQGDVGSGKNHGALASCHGGRKTGYRPAFMAPDRDPGTTARPSSCDSCSNSSDGRRNLARPADRTKEKPARCDERLGRRKSASRRPHALIRKGVGFAKLGLVSSEKHRSEVHCSAGNWPAKASGECARHERDAHTRTLTLTLYGRP